MDSHFLLLDKLVTKRETAFKVTSITNSHEDIVANFQAAKRQLHNRVTAPVIDLAEIQKN